MCFFFAEDGSGTWHLFCEGNLAETIAGAHHANLHEIWESFLDELRVCEGYFFILFLRGRLKLNSFIRSILRFQ
jgi:hypothetical protein